MYQHLAAILVFISIGVVSMPGSETYCTCCDSLDPGSIDFTCTCLCNSHGQPLPPLQCDDGRCLQNNSELIRYVVFLSY